MRIALNGQVDDLLRNECANLVKAAGMYQAFAHEQTGYMHTNSGAKDWIYGQRQRILNMLNAWSQK